MSSETARDVDREARELVQEAFEAARGGDSVRLDDLLARGVPPDVVNQRGDGLLMLASYHGHEAATQLLLRHGAEVDRTNDRGQSPLAGAAFKGDASIATLLLDHGAAVDGTAPDGKTPLMYAALFDRIELVDLLLARGADRHRRDHGGATALDAARATGAGRAAARLAGEP